MKNKITKENLSLSLILILSAILNLVNINKEGYGNKYYAAGVKSMTMSLKNFFFVSFDPSGFVSLDKPPIGFWIQTIFAKLLGFHGWSILLTQAIAGVISVYLVYKLVKRSFGSVAGLISATCLSITPVFVAASRNNTIDNLLVFVLLLACFALTIAAETGNTAYLYISLILVGIGFNIKMLEAYMIVPAIYITYLLSSSNTIKKKLVHLTIGTIILLTVSFSWAIIVDLVPIQNRPYVGGSTNNNVMQLVLGHNGLERLGLQGTQGNQTSAGITRLLSKNSLSDQIIWFLPLALFGFLAGAIKEKLRLKLDNKRKVSLVLWFIWLVPEFLYFSFTTGLFHTYYLTMMAPPAAALSGIGVVSMWQLYKEGKWKSWLLPISFTAEGIIQMIMLSYYQSVLPSALRFTILFALILCFVTSILFIIFNIIYILKRNNKIKQKKVFLIIALFSILVTPFLGASATMIFSVNSKVPSSGLELFSKDKKGSDSNAINKNENSSLINFLKKNKTTEKYFLAVSSAQSAQNIILQTGESVMALGGYSGSDPTMTLAEFKELIKNGELRYVLVGGQSGGITTEIMDWVTENGKLVFKSNYIDTVSNNTQNNNSDSNNQKSENISNDEQNTRDLKNKNLFRQLNLYNTEDLYDMKAIADTLNKIQ